FYRRNHKGRPNERYLQGFKKIRRIQKYMVSSALMRGVPTIPHLDLDATLSQIIDHVIDKALSTVEQAQAGGAPGPLRDGREAEPRPEGAPSP
ncbi:MAG TPA: hypothetical protein VE712_05400, partial [Actinomycetota bacterium]|nr:hypothetical protein [Actinomycetota bacterium]